MPRMPMDKFSRLIAAHAFARFPEWRQRVRRVPSSDGTVALLLELPAPVEARVECGLSLSTEDREITISFAAWHEHLQGTRRHERRPGSPEDRARAAWQSAEQFLDDLCAERTVVASWWFESHWRSSQCAPAGSPLGEPEAAYSNRRRVRSWKGTFNEDVRTDTFDTIARLPCPSCGEIDGGTVRASREGHPPVLVPGHALPSVWGRDRRGWRSLRAGGSSPTPSGCRGDLGSCAQRAGG